MSTAICELCQSERGGVVIRDGVRLVLCDSCLRDIDEVDMGTGEMGDYLQSIADEDDHSQDWQYLGPNKDHGANFDW